VPERRFTRAEAEAALARIRPLVARMVERHRELRALQKRERRLLMRIASNGGDLTPSDVTDLQAELERVADDLRRAVDEIEAAGAVVKDLATGLVDFPSDRDGETVYLCWQLGEGQRIAFWHDLDAGFAGRKIIED
jgi:hypothetical protein